MYAPAPFRMTDPAEAVELIRARRFASVVVCGADGPVAAHVPVQAGCNAQGELEQLVFHVARNNPLASLAEGHGRALAIVHGGDAYVSPGAYPSKAEHGRVVPTWNYMTVEVAGRLETFKDAGALKQLVSDLSDTMEQDGETPWSVEDAPADYIDRMLNAITGVRLHVDSLTGKAKLSQNKSAADHAGVVDALNRNTAPGARIIARAMTHNRS